MQTYKVPACKQFTENLDFLVELQWILGWPSIVFTGVCIGHCHHCRFGPTAFSFGPPAFRFGSPAFRFGFGFSFLLIHWVLNSTLYICTCMCNVQYTLPLTCDTVLADTLKAAWFINALDKAATIIVSRLTLINIIRFCKLISNMGML